MGQTTYLEVGNTTIKIGHRTPDGRWTIERVGGAEATLNRLQRLGPDPDLLIAPVAGERGAELTALLEERGVRYRSITREDFADFLGDSYDTPETLGLDRILNLAGLREDAVVISCGTCITVDMRADRRPHFGAILPGYATAARGMSDAVPALPKALLHGDFTIPSRTSQSSVNLGILLGTTEAALGIARHLIGGVASATIPLVLTGGGANVMVEMLGKIERTAAWPTEDVRVVGGLVFEGMREVCSS